MGRKSKEQLEKEALENGVGPQEEAKVETVTSDSFKEEKEKEEKEETVQVKKSDLSKMMAQIEKLTKDSELLFKASDKQRMAKALNEGGEVLIKQAKISTWDDTGKFIVGWKLISDRCEVVLGRWIEEQNVTFVFEDGETKTVPLLEFYRKTLKKVSGDIISKTDEYDVQNNKIQIFKIQFPNGKSLSINSAFIN